MLRVRPCLTNEPDFREWTPEERESWLREQADKLRNSKFQNLERKDLKDLAD